MLIRDVQFPISDGVVIAGIRSGLVARGWGSGLTVARKLPATKTRRMVIVSNDAGPNEGRVSRRRYRLNFYADDSSDAENLAYVTHSVVRVLPDGQIIVGADQFADPFEVEDDEPFVVGGKNLFHFSSACRISVKGSKP